ncbi:MAG TPA: FkbM family methyltransferase [Xanthobacteraceae bacterium]|nr:FkbM family methyltransferase [Xanthobacteraceae bacterium]
MAIVSYAQNFEDVMLARCFPGQRGFYVDVGANDPDIDNLTRHFYERGWRGINIEPLASNFARLKKRRTRDLNLHLAAGEHDGSITFYEVGKWHGYSTTDEGIAAQHRKDGLRVIEHKTPMRRLASVLDEHAKGKTVDFLSIDVEGAELSVLAGADFRRHRPKIILAESRLPVTVNMVDRFFEVPDRTADYAAFLAPLGYSLVYRDGLNAFFVADEHASLARHFDYPPGIADRLTHAASVRPCEEKVAKLRRELAALRSKGRSPGIKRRTTTRAGARPKARKRRK